MGEIVHTSRIKIAREKDPTRRAILFTTSSLFFLLKPTGGSFPRITIGKNNLTTQPHNLSDKAMKWDLQKVPI